jgi:hypothetical protein
MQVKVTVNERGALRNGRYAFTNKYTLVTELLQNSRRAGATQVHVQYDEATKVLIVEDDGDGIADFQKLLTLNESGWDESMQQQEHPFGLGFSKVLYAAERCNVQSRGMTMDFITSEALEQREINVIDDPKVDPYRTRITLYGVELPDLKARIAKLVRGFSIPVVYNGVILDRPHSLEAKPFVDTPIGQVHLSGVEAGEVVRCRAVYLQGFCVYESSLCSDDHAHVVHLDAGRFMARLPDRTMLIDEREQLDLVEAQLRALLKQVLVEQRAALSGEAFCNRYWRLAHSWQLAELFDTVPWLPKALCHQIVDYPEQGDWFEPSYLEEWVKPVSRADIERGEVLLATLDCPDETNMASWMLARHRGYMRVQASMLSDQHWVHAHVRHLNEEPVEVTVLGETHQVLFEGQWITVALRLCEKYRLRVGHEGGGAIDSVEISDEALFDGETILMPQGEGEGNVILQVSAYVNEDEHRLDSHIDSDRAALAVLVRRLRFTSPQEALASLLGDLGLNRYPLLRGLSFRVSIDEGGLPKSVELADSLS